MKKFKNLPNLPRYTVIIGVFAVICLIFSIRLVSYQLTGTDTVLSRNYDMKTYT